MVSASSGLAVVAVLEPLKLSAWSLSAVVSDQEQDLVVGSELPAWVLQLQATDLEQFQFA